MLDLFDKVLYKLGLVRRSEYDELAHALGLMASEMVKEATDVCDKTEESKDLFI